MTKKLLTAFFLTVFFIPGMVLGQLRLPTFFTNHMVLQRDKPVNIWGWGQPGLKVKISCQKQDWYAVTGNDSTWRVVLPERKAGGPYELVVSDNKQTLTVHDIYFGDVWFCSGQSNMNFRMKDVMNHDQEITDADYPQICQLDGNRVGAEFPQQNVLRAAWVPCNSKTVDGFSAVAFLFARQLYKKYGVPIGIINASWGGSPIEAFMSMTSLTNFPQYKQQLDALVPGFIKETREKKMMLKDQWIQHFFSACQFISSDGALTRDPFFFNAKDWQAIQVPVLLEDQKIQASKGVCWYKKEFDISAETAEKDLTIDLGRINYASIAYLNGVKLGTQWSPYNNLSFRLPTGLTKTGKNELIVAAYNDFGKTGFQPLYRPKLTWAGEAKNVIFLDEQWYFKQGKTVAKTGELGPNPAIDFENGYPSLLYNSMIAPFNPLVVKGVLWYQGEANTDLPGAWQYEKLLTAMITDWRTARHDDQLPFLIVQLPNYGELNAIPHASGWAIVQEAQASVAKNVTHSDFITINDLGTALNIHPTNKQEVSRRLALLAEKEVYGEPVQVHGPQFKVMKKEGNKLVLSFDQEKGALRIADNKADLNGFTIAGSDHQFYRATATIKDDKVIVFSSQVPDPVDVRYAFESNPPKVNFYNSAGLPAVPFRTDKLLDAKERY